MEFNAKMDITFTTGWEGKIGSFYCQPLMSEKDDQGNVTSVGLYDPEEAEGKDPEAWGVYARMEENGESQWLMDTDTEDHANQLVKMFDYMCANHVYATKEPPATKYLCDVISIGDIHADSIAVVTLDYIESQKPSYQDKGSDVREGDENMYSISILDDEELLRPYATKAFFGHRFMEDIETIKLDCEKRDVCYFRIIHG